MFFIVSTICLSLVIVVPLVTVGWSVLPSRGTDPMPVFVVARHARRGARETHGRRQSSPRVRQNGACAIKVSLARFHERNADEISNRARKSFLYVGETRAGWLKGGRGGGREKQVG